MVVNDVREFIARIMTGPTQAEDDLWNAQIANVFPDLTGNSLRAYVNNSTDFIRYGADQEAQIVMCNMDQVNAEVTKSGDLLFCGCTRRDSCNIDDMLCINGVDDESTWSGDDDDIDSIQSRDLTLEKRSGVRPFNWKFTSPIDNQEHSGSSPSFPVRKLVYRTAHSTLANAM